MLKHQIKVVTSLCMFTIGCGFLFSPTGEVIFNYSQPELPPDFIFDAMDQEFVPDIEEIEVP